MTMRSEGLLVWCLALLASCGAQSSGPLQYRLPDELYEISGLAALPNDHVLAVADERAVVFQIDPLEGRVIGRWQLGDRGRKGDFEGVAVRGELIYLVTSDGLVLELERESEERLALLREIGTRVGKRCEVEGLEASAAQPTLYLLCKKARKKALRGKVALIAWDLEADEERVDESILLDDQAVIGDRPSALRPSAVMRLGEGWVGLSARQLGTFRFDRTSAQPLAGFPTDARHVQPEGIAVLSDGSWVVADEGGGRFPARLTVYPDGF